MTSAWYLHCVGSQLLLCPESMSLPDQQLFPAAGRDLLDAGEWAGRPVWVVPVEQPVAPAESYEWLDLRHLIAAGRDDFFGLAARALQLIEWQRTHQFCGVCGTGMVRQVGQERVQACPACGHTAYPRINPCVIGVVRRGRELLLARAHRFRNGMFSALAGFMEVGESAEDTLHREVLEEVGVRIRDIRYIGSQAWPFPSNLMLGFVAEYDGGELTLQDDEIAEAGFFPPEALPPVPPHGSIARALIEYCLQERP